MRDHIHDARKMVVDTPRADEKHNDLLGWDTYEAWQDMHAFARQLERELNAANQRIKRLEESGEAMYDFINPPLPFLRTSRMDSLLQGWDDAKANK